MSKKAKPATTSPKPNARRLRQPRLHRWRRTPKAARPALLALPSARSTLGQVWSLLWRHKKLFAGIVLIYAVASLILVQGNNSIDIQSLKNNLSSTFKEQGSEVATSLSIVGYLLSSSAGSAYQIVLLIIVSLACIWALRQVTADHKVRARDAYYRGMSPLVPFVLVLAVAVVQLIPLALGATAYNIITTYGVVSGPVEITIWIAAAIFLTVWSVYMVLPTLISLYLVTLPDMTPRQALRSARRLARFRRWDIIRKLLLLIVVLLLILSLLMVPIIMFVASLAGWIFFVLSLFLILFIHAYIYSLYRELLENAPNT